MYVDRQCVISVRGQPLKAIDRLRLALINGEPLESSLDVVVHFLQYANDIFGGAIVTLREVVDEMEDQILKGNFYEKRSELGTVRRSMARLRRHLNGNRHALSHHLLPRLPPWCRDIDVVELRRNIERLLACYPHYWNFWHECGRFALDSGVNWLLVGDPCHVYYLGHYLWGLTTSTVFLMFLNCIKWA